MYFTKKGMFKKTRTAADWINLWSQYCNHIFRKLWFVDFYHWNMSCGKYWNQVIIEWTSVELWQLFHGISEYSHLPPDLPHVLKDLLFRVQMLNALSVGIITGDERPRDGVGKFPVSTWLNIIWDQYNISIYSCAQFLSLYGCKYLNEWTINIDDDCYLYKVLLT